MITGHNSSELWLWRVVVGAYVLTVAGSTSFSERADESADSNDADRAELAKLADWYKEQLSKRRQATWAPEWDAAKEILEKIYWLQIPGSHGEFALEKLWQHSVRESGAQ